MEREEEAVDANLFACNTSTASGVAKQSVRVLQWNTLADGLAQHGDFVMVIKFAIMIQVRMLK